MPGAAARGDEAPEVSAPRHAPSANPALRLRSSHAPLAPAVRPARGHEDVVTVHDLLAHAAAEVEIGPAVRLPASLWNKVQSHQSSIDQEIVPTFIMDRNT